MSLDYSDEIETEIGVRLTAHQKAVIGSLNTVDASALKELIDDVYEKAFDDAGRELCGGSE